MQIVRRFKFTSKKNTVYLIIMIGISFVGICIFTIVAGHHEVLGLVYFSEQEIDVTMDQTRSVTLIMSENEKIIGSTVRIKLDIEDENIISITSGRIIFANASYHPTSFFVMVKGLIPGKSDISTNVTATNIQFPSSFIIINVNKSNTLSMISYIIGWMYSIFWAISFYPQNWTNYERKSVVGLNFDLVTLNIAGYLCYAIFNVGLYYIPTVREQYAERYPKSIIPVLLNDIFFSVHGVILVSITGIQCLIYESEKQRISKIVKLLHSSFAAILVLSIILVPIGTINALDFMYICSYIKLVVTLTKYIPQAYMNYCRQSTEGWNIYNVLGDFFGGVLSIIQMFLNAYNYDEWGALLQNPTKFWLGMLTMVFDLIFIVQHYVLYRKGYVPQGSEESFGEEEKKFIK